tara:strand:+ start:672 stop:950 length:279 start_codon:yes stop_codon:yes gene_type:complete
VLSILSAGPGLLIWSVAEKWLPDRYYLPPVRMTALCILLSLLTAFAINLELEGGGISMIMAILFLTAIWSIFLLPFAVLLKYLLVKQREKNT